MATPVTAAPATLRVTIELDLADALGVGHSMRMLVRQGKTPPGTADTYARVGDALVAAGRAAIVKGTKP